MSTTPDSASADVQKPTPKIAPADGKLGILIPGMGAVTTTFIAGVEAIKAGIAKPIGSVTQLSTIRLGKRTDNNTPKIKDFVPLAADREPRIRRLGHFRRELLRSRRSCGRARAPAARTAESSARKNQTYVGRIRP